MYHRFNQYEFGFRGAVTPVVKKLIILNIAVFILEYLFSSIYHLPIRQLFGLIPQKIYPGLMIWQLGTYMFLHGGFFHLLINMFVLWMFGCEIERQWGSREFLTYYLFCGVGAGILNFIAMPGSPIPTVGASGAIYGILVAFAMLFPNRLIYLYFLIPIRAKYFVLIFGAIAFLSAFTSAADGIAHFAHLGGMIFGFLYIKLDWRLPSILERFRKMKAKRRMKVVYRKEKAEQDFKEEIDRILDKISDVGIENLTKEEKKLLEKASHLWSQEESKWEK